MDDHVQVSLGRNCFKSHCTSVTKVTDLQFGQEESDPRIFLHPAYEVRSGLEKLVIHNPDTDIFIISLMVSDILQADIYLNTGVKDKRRTVILIDVKTYFDEVINMSGKCESDFLEAFVGLHASTGCNKRSAFSGNVWHV